MFKRVWTQARNIHFCQTSPAVLLPHKYFGSYNKNVLPMTITLRFRQNFVEYTNQSPVRTLTDINKSLYPPFSGF